MTDRLPWTFSVYQRVGDGKWCVFVTHDTTPEWSRLLAEFPSKDRAVSYAEIENDIAHDGDITSFPDVCPAPDTLPLAPANSVKAENFRPTRDVSPRPPSPAEKARVGAHLMEAAAEETGGGTVVLDIPGIDAVVTAKADSVIAQTFPQRTGRPKLADETNDQRCAALLKAITAHVAEIGEFPSMAQMGAGSGIPVGSLRPYLDQLEKEGKIIRVAGARSLASAPDVVGALRNGETSAKDRVLAAVIEFYAADGDFPRWGDLAAKANVPSGSLGFHLDALEKDGDIIRDKYGVRYLKGHAPEDAPPEPKKPEPARIKVRPEVAAAVASFPIRNSNPSAIRKEIADADQTGRLDHKIQRRCQSCSTVFMTDSIQQYHCVACGSSASRRA